MIRVFRDNKIQFIVIIIICLINLNKAAFAKAPSEFGISILPAMERYNFLTLYLNWRADFEKSLKEAVTDFGVDRTLVAKRWNEIETAKGSYDFDDLDYQLNLLQRYNQDVYFSFQLINTLKREVPDDLVQRRWNDPLMVERTFTILKETLGRFDKSKHVYLSFGNEVDVYFEKYPNEIDDFLELRDKVIAYCAKNFPFVTVGVTTTYDGLIQSRQEIIQRIQKSHAHVMLTYYALDGFQVRPPQSPLVDFEKIKSFFPGRKILLQEVGYPSAAIVGSSQEAQAAFFKAIIEAWRRNKEIYVYMNIFIQTDFSSKVCKDFTHYYGYSSKDYREQFAGMMCSLGIRDSRGNPKAAWDVLKNALSEEARKEIK